MSKIMKKAITILLATLMVVSMVACGGGGKSFSYDGKETKLSHELKNDYKEGDYENYIALTEQADALLSEGTDFEAFKTALVKVWDYKYEFWGNYVVSYVNYYIYGKSEDANDYVNYITMFYDATEWIEGTEHALADSPFKADYFVDMTDEEIAEYLGEQKSERYYELQAEQNEIISAYYQLDYEDYYDGAAEYYLRLIDVNNGIAEEEGYENYSDYAYPNVYGRDYSVDETDEYFENVKKYIYPAYIALNERTKAAFSSFTDEEKKLCNDFEHSNGFVNYMSDFKKYARYMGGEFLKAYNYLWNGKGYYFISQESGAPQAAFTWALISGEPFVFFSKEYQDIITLVHEFGHYFAHWEGGGDGGMDLSETQSQANEFLFTKYFLNNCDYSDNVKSYILDKKMLNAAKSVITCSIINEFEKFAYTVEDPTAEVLDEYMESLNDMVPEIGGQEYLSFLKRYWRAVCIDNAAYYISYSVSLISSLEIYAEAVDDFSAGKVAYLKICNPDAYPTYRGTVTDAGLADPLSEEAFVAIYNALLGIEEEAAIAA